MISFTLHKTLRTTDGGMLLDVSCDIAEGQMVAIYGPSGAGKTTILRMLAGLDIPEDGKIVAGPTMWLDTHKNVSIPTQKRNVGMVFQDYALFPNMTTRGNLEYALNKGGDKNIIDELIEIMELGQLSNRYPHTLSGGQKQRVALARALVRRPMLLLLDEPLSALDNEMRAKLQDHIITAHNYYNLTTILVSHDISEIFKMASKIFVLENGQIKKQGNVSEVFTNQQVSCKFQFTGDVLSIDKEDIIYVVSVLINNGIVKVVATHEDIINLKQGDRVLVFAKAFNPIIQKIEL